MKSFLPFFILNIFFLGAGCNTRINPAPVACTMEAKICPDGSAVGRGGPSCDFAPCPLVPNEPSTSDTVRVVPSRF